jgi:hypothetical protein
MAETYFDECNSFIVQIEISRAHKWRELIFASVTASLGRQGVISIELTNGGSLFLRVQPLH